MAAAKQGAEHGYSHIRGLNAQLATVSGPEVAPVIAAARLRRGAAASSHGAVRLLRDAIATLRRAGVTGQVLVPTVPTTTTTWCPRSSGPAPGSRSVPRLNPSVRAQIGTIDEQAWTPIVYPNAIVDPDTDELISTADIAEVGYTAFTSHKGGPVTGRLIVRRVPERNTKKLAAAAQDGLFQVWRYHALFTNHTAPGAGGQQGPHQGPAGLIHIADNQGIETGFHGEDGRSAPWPHD